ncbi:MAG: regulatory iron-sulfur-containing complex subunit RicT [Bacteroidota bacterium]|jgi:cell fate regulator YaaT (PSP1 superfamily)
MNKDRTNTIEDQDEVQEFKSTESEENINIDEIIISSPVSVERTQISENKFLTRGMAGNPSETNCNKPLKHQCCKLDATNWLSDINTGTEHPPFTVAEVRFKNNRKDFFKLPEEGVFEEGDVVAVEASPGHDIGIISLYGELVKLQMKNKKIDPDSDDLKKIYRRARATDLEKWVSTIEKEDNALLQSRVLASDLHLTMKFNDVEYQGDGTKAVFYYSAEDRVDFRELIKTLAERFRVRIEMRQIGVRQEAARVGGIGICGRELCCSSWLTSFNSVTTNTARAQQLTLNPQKLAGQCGKLKCCLNYEYETYLAEYKTFPDINIVLKTLKGDAIYQKTDIFKKAMWYSYRHDQMHLYAIPVEKVNFVIQENLKGKMPESIEDFALTNVKQTEYDMSVQNEDLSRFDKKKLED